LGVSDIKSYFVDKSLLSTVGFIINEFCEKHFDGPLKGNWLSDEKPLLLFFYDRITKQKHHSILGSIFLLKQTQNESPKDLKEIFIPSALAIALHHYNQVFNVVYYDDKGNPADSAWASLPKERKIETIDFNVNPLAFILMFCDCVQDWGRPNNLNKPLAKPENDQSFELGDCIIESNECSIQIRNPKSKNTDPIFKGKYEEITALEKLLRPPKNFDFQITLQDMKGKISELSFEE
jgi:hypothetical protein